MYVTFDILPITKDPRYRFSMTLNGELFNFRVNYNERAGKYFLSIYDSEMEEILLGVALLPNANWDCPRVSTDGFFLYSEHTEVSGTREGDKDPFYLPDRCTLYFFNAVEEEVS